MIFLLQTEQDDKKMAKSAIMWRIDNYFRNKLVDYAFEGSLLRLKLLLKLPFVDTIGSNFKNGWAISAAVHANQPHIIEYLLGRDEFKKYIRPGMYPGENILLVAAKNNYKDMVNVLLAAGINPNVKGDNDNTALHLTTRVGIALSLTDAGALVDAQNEDGNTPLHVAAIKGNVKLAYFLINDGKADVTIKNQQGLTARQLAKLTGNEELIELFPKPIFRTKRFNDLRALIYNDTRPSFELSPSDDKSSLSTTEKVTSSQSDAVEINSGNEEPVELDTVLDSQGDEQNILLRADTNEGMLNPEQSVPTVVEPEPVIKLEPQSDPEPILFTPRRSLRLLEKQVIEASLQSLAVAIKVEPGVPASRRGRRRA